MDERDIFIQVIQAADPAQEAALVQDLCGQDHEMRQRVEALLDAHGRAASFLESPPTDFAVTTDSPPIAERPGTVIGPYKLLQQIGEGGMGVVFMAEQSEPLQRTVALKIIKPGMDTRQVITRFEAERQAVAMMDHPNIAKVLDAGTTDSGRPYFVMELVKGVPITKYCDEKHLPLRARLELFIEVCQAVQHAHQKGIIHRDIKPTNVIVAEYDNHAVPKVIDFGVAKATAQKLTERTMFTEYGQVIGTVEYMSPEQAKLNQLDIDTRSDVYSLGVLLYELLTGSTPFEQKRLREAAFDEVLRIIREEEPPKPSTKLSTSDTLPSIAANRHTEPARLGRDLRGELDWIVMKAMEKDRNRRYQTANAFASDIQHHLHDEPVQACPPSARYKVRKLVRKYRVPLAVAAGFVLVLVAASIVSTWQAVRATRAEALAQTRLEAETRARDRAITEALKANAVSDLLREMFESAAPNPKAGPNYTVRQLLDDFSSRIGDQVKDKPEVELAIRATIGNTYRRLALPKEAEPQLRKALELRRRVYGAEHISVADGLMDYAWNLRQAGDGAGAERSAREALAIFQKQNADAKRTLSAYSSLLNFLIKQSKYAETETVGREALASARALGLDGQAAGILQDLSTVKRVTGSAADAEPLSREALALQRRIHGAWPPPYTILEHATNLSFQGKRAEAEPLLREALEGFRHRNFDDSHPSVIDVKVKLSGLLRENGDRAGMKAVLAPVPAHLQEAIKQAPDNLILRSRRAHVLRDLEELDEAIKEYSEVLSRRPDSLMELKERGDCYLRKNELSKAEADFNKVIELVPKQSEGWTGRAFSHFHRQQWEKAIADFSKAIELAPQVHTNWFHRGHIYLHLAQWDKAAADFTKVIEGWPDDPGGWFLRALAYAQLNQPETAIADLRQAIAKGLKDVVEHLKNAMLNPLRSNEEFKKLLAKMEAEQK